MASLRVVLKTARADSVSSASSASTRRSRGSAYSECRKKRTECSHDTNREVVNISDDEDISEQPIQRRKAKRGVDSDDDEDDLSTTGTSTSRSAPPVTTAVDEDVEVTSMSQTLTDRTATPSSTMARSGAEVLRPPTGPLNATAAEVGAWDTQLLIVSKNRTALLVQLLLWAEAEEQKLVHQYHGGNP